MRPGKKGEEPASKTSGTPKSTVQRGTKAESGRSPTPFTGRACIPSDHGQHCNNILNRSDSGPRPCSLRTRF